jgi:branched-chain amino acid transport system ATP-binding protein
MGSKENPQTRGSADQGAENGSLLKAEDIHLSFGGVKALDGVSLHVQKGEVLSLIGPNGAGKTCLINCITGYYRPQKGRIGLGSRDITRFSPYRISRLGICRTFQNPTTYPNMTAMDILMAARFSHSRTTLLEAAVHYGRSRREELANLKKVEETIRFVQIEDLRLRRVSTLSYGQRKQVEIARALSMEPEILLLDEPMSGLDEVMKEIISDLIIAMQKRGSTIVLIEHDFQAVTELSRTVVVLAGGRQIAQGSPQEIARDPRVIDAYLGGGIREPGNRPGAPGGRTGGGAAE